MRGLLCTLIVICGVFGSLLSVAHYDPAAVFIGKIFFPVEIIVCSIAAMSLTIARIDRGAKGQTFFYLKQRLSRDLNKTSIEGLLFYLLIFNLVFISCLVSTHPAAY